MQNVAASLNLNTLPLGATRLDDAGKPADGFPAYGFKVWAPNAKAVCLKGNFNHTNWAQQAIALKPQDNGMWAVVVPGCKPGDAYQFQIQTPANTWVTRRDPYGRGVTTDQTASVLEDDTFNWTCQSFDMPPFNELVLYEMHVGTFNTTVKKPSTFADCAKKIPYLKKLGVNAVSVMPICTFPGDYSWGYNPTDFFAVDNAYGGNAQFKQFIDTCHQAGIAVILDLVYNHAGPDNIDLWQFDGWSENDAGGIYFYQDNRAITPWGHTRFDYGRGEVRQFLKDNAMMWMDEYRIDGARFDATVYIRKINHEISNEDLREGWTLLQWINASKNERFPWKLTIGEDLGYEPWVVKTVGEGGAGFDAQWDTEFVHVIREQLIMPTDADRDMTAIQHIIEKRFTDSAFTRVIYSESHDDVANGKARVTYEIDHQEDDDRSFFSKKRSILGAGITLTAPGIPMIFQGQEMLENKWFEDDDPLDWFLAKKYQGIIQAYSDLIKLRRNLANTTRGLCGHGCEVFHINNNQKVIAFHRWDSGLGDDVVVVANFSNQSHVDYHIGMPKPGIWKVRFNSSSKLYDPYIDAFDSLDTEAYEAQQDEHTWSANIGLGAYALIILSQDT
jgi:1,4-alpha-glucan branching enzyme